MPSLVGGLEGSSIPWGPEPVPRGSGGRTQVTPHPAHLGLWGGAAVGHRRLPQAGCAR